MCGLVGLGWVGGLVGCSRRDCGPPKLHAPVHVCRMARGLAPPHCCEPRARALPLHHRPCPALPLHHRPCPAPPLCSWKITDESLHALARMTSLVRCAPAAPALHLSSPLKAGTHCQLGLYLCACLAASWLQRRARVCMLQPAGLPTWGARYGASQCNGPSPVTPSQVHAWRAVPAPLAACTCWAATG